MYSSQKFYTWDQFHRCLQIYTSRLATKSSFASERSRIETSLEGKTPSLLALRAHSTKYANLPQKNQFTL